ncbi:PAS domain-containing protein, partial [Trichostrongylus colubriformis]
GHNYVVMHCTGYIKNTPPTGIDAPPSSCLVAIARLQVASMPLCDPTELTRISMRIADDGKMTFVDARVSQLLGLTPDQLVGRFWWQVMHPSDEQSLHESFIAMMTRDQPMRLNCRIRSANDYRPCSISAYKFLNPFNDQFEFVVATHHILTGDEESWIPTSTEPGPAYVPPGAADYASQDWRPQQDASRDAATVWNAWDPQNYPPHS